MCLSWTCRHAIRSTRGWEYLLIRPTLTSATAAGQRERCPLSRGANATLTSEPALSASANYRTLEHRQLTPNSKIHFTTWPRQAVTDMTTWPRSTHEINRD